MIKSDNNEFKRKIAVLTFMTLDGVMQSPSSKDEDPSNDFLHGGWAHDYWDGVMAQVMKEAMSAPYDILFGRKTYELFANHWSDQSEETPVSAILNRAKKYVVSNSLEEVNWNNSVLINDHIIEKINDLKKQDGPLIQIHGSWQLIQTLLSANLIDEFRIWVFPIVVGSGKCLFGPDLNLFELKHVKTEETGNGVVMHVYRQCQAHADGE